MNRNPRFLTGAVAGFVLLLSSTALSTVSRAVGSPAVPRTIVAPHVTDFNGDGYVDGRDNGQFNRRFGQF